MPFHATELSVYGNICGNHQLINLHESFLIKITTTNSIAQLLGNNNVCFSSSE